jgi:hypothetical protein
LFSPNWVFLYPGLLLVILSLVVGGTLVLHGPFCLGNVRLGIDTLIYSGFFAVAGFQAVFFSMMSRLYAVQEGLFPNSLLKSPWSRGIKLEYGLISGIIIFLLGVAAAIYALIFWTQSGFGELDADRIARVVIPSAVAMTLGVEIVFSSFLQSALKLGVRTFTDQPTGEYLAESMSV